MGKGDIKTKKGKRFANSYGKLRPRKTKISQFIVNPVAIKKEQEEEVEKKSEKKVEKKNKSTSKAKKKPSKEK